MYTCASNVMRMFLVVRDSALPLICTFSKATIETLEKGVGYVWS